MSAHGPFGALVEVEATRTFRYLRWYVLVATALTGAALVIEGDLSELLAKITIGVLLFVCAPGAMAGRDKLQGTLVLLQRLPVSASVVVAAKFVVAALALLVIAGLGALVATEILALNPLGTVGFFFLCWLPLTLANWLMIGVVLRIDPERFPWIVGIIIGAGFVGGHVWEWLDAGRVVRHAWRTGTLPAALGLACAVAFLGLAGIAFWMASSGIRRYDPGRAEADY